MRAQRYCRRQGSARRDRKRRHAVEDMARKLVQLQPLLPAKCLLAKRMSVDSSPVSLTSSYLKYSRSTWIRPLWDRLDATRRSIWEGGCCRDGNVDRCHDRWWGPR